MLQGLEAAETKSLFQNSDQLAMEMQRHEVFYDFEEPEMVGDFFPTYKKYEQRQPLDYHNPSWVRQCYHTQYREPIYKGGRVKERVPGWCDRILYHSLQDLRVLKQLRPESVPSTLIPSQRSIDDLQRAAEAAAEDDDIRDADGEATDGDGDMVHQYFAVNEGPGVAVSDHSPVVATFLLDGNIRSSTPLTTTEAEAEAKTEMEAGAGAGAGAGQPSTLRSFVRIESFKVMSGMMSDGQVPAAMSVTFPAPFEGLGLASDFDADFRGSAASGLRSAAAAAQAQQCHSETMRARLRDVSLIREAMVCPPHILPSSQTSSDSPSPICPSVS